MSLPCLPALAVTDLPAVNASLNALAAVLLVVGWFLIRQRRRNAHRWVMLSAVAVSALFLTSYLVYHAQVGSVRFQGQGTVRTVYLSILLTHTVLAAVVPVLAVLALVFAFRRQFARHKKVTRWALPIWLYVSVTGVVVYWMLYQMSW
jgi:putative membrane protein